MKKNEKIYVIRNKSIITEKKNLEKIFSIKNFPVFIGSTDKPLRTDLFFDMQFFICKDTGVIQLKKVLLPKLIYSTYHSEALGTVWKEHHLKFIGFLEKFKPLKVLEIGGSNGFIAKNYISENTIDKWIIVEPNPSVESNAKIKIIKKIFDSKFKTNEKIDTVVHSHTLEHIYEPKKFLDDISNILPINGLNVFSVPNLFEYMKSKQSNVLNFEHTIFLTEYFIDELLKMYGFKIIIKKYFKKHSIFYATQKIGSIPREYKGKNMYKVYKTMFNKYIKYYEKLISELNIKINKFDGEVYVFGAHVFSQFLFSFNLSNKIFGILDNSKIKQGQRLYGTPFLIHSPLKIKKGKKAVILRAGMYQKEIKKQLLKINPDLIIWE